MKGQIRCLFEEARQHLLIKASQECRSSSNAGEIDLFLVREARQNLLIETSRECRPIVRGDDHSGELWSFVRLELT